MPSTKPTNMIKPSDAVSWISCTRRVWLDNRNTFSFIPIKDEFGQLLIQFGLDHEKAVLDKLRIKFDVYTATSVEGTKQLMSEGVEVIYQAQLQDDANGIVGYPDFLIRQDNGEYQAADAKLSLHPEKKEIQIQLGLYRKLLGNGLPAIAYLGDGSQSEVTDKAEPSVDLFINDMNKVLALEVQPFVRYGHSKCKPCPYYEHCIPIFTAKEELSLLYGIQGLAADGLESVGIQTISDLSNAQADNIPDIPYLKGFDKKNKAILQAKSWQTGEIFQTGQILLPEGTWIHFDIENNPLTPNGKSHVYLWGFLLPEYSNQNFEYVWTNHQSEDKEGWLTFINKIDLYRLRYPDLILAHYSKHEHSTIRHYADRYHMEDNEIVQWLLGEESPLFDIQQSVKNNLVLPLKGYGLKDICKHKDLVNFQWGDSDSGSQWSVVQFNNFLNEKNSISKEKLKKEILGYNRDDVMATYRLERWLRALEL